MSRLNHAPQDAGVFVVATYGLAKRYRAETALDSVDFRMRAR